MALTIARKTGHVNLHRHCRHVANQHRRYFKILFLESFTQNNRSRPLLHPPSPRSVVHAKFQCKDFQLATGTLLRQSQLASFPTVLGKLLRKVTLSFIHKLLSLNPLTGERQIIRSSGRLQYAPLPAATRMPVVLDAHNAITRLFMLHFHEICPHTGPEHLKSFLQQPYFIFCRPCCSAHHQLSLLPMPPLSHRKRRANDGALTPMPISIQRYAISFRQVRSRCVWTINHCQRKTN